MNKFLKAATFLLLSSLALAAPTPTKITTNSVLLGDGTSSDKTYEFNVGASNPRLKWSVSNSRFEFNKNNILLGDGIAGNKIIRFDVGAGSSNPLIRWNDATQTLQFSNDNASFSNFGSGGGGGAGIEFIELQAHLDKSFIRTDTVDFTAREGFQLPEVQNDLWLLEAAVASGTSITAITNPIFVSNSDQNFDSTTGWNLFGAATTLTTSATRKIGATSLSINKDGSAQVAAINENTIPLSLAGYSNVWFWVNLPTLTGVDSVLAYFCSDTLSANCAIFNTTLNSSGGALVAGWNLIHIDSSGTPTTTIGTSWNPNLIVNSLNVGVKTTLSATTLTGVLFDGLAASPNDNSLLVQQGDTYTMYDLTNSEEIKLSSANSVNEGVLTLAGSIINNYSGGTASNVKRTNASVGSGTARFTEGGSGAADLVQVVRRKNILKSSVSGTAFNLTVSENSPLAFVVSSVDSSVQIKISDVNNNSAQFSTGDKYHVFQTFKVNGKKQYSYKNLLITLDAVASNGGGLTTLHNSSTNSGIAVGDTILKASLDTQVSLVATGSDESFGSALAETDMDLEDLGIAYPQPNKVYGHWHLGGTGGEKNLKGPAPDLTINSGPIPTVDFFNGIFGAGPFLSTKSFSLPAWDGATDYLAGDSTTGHSSLALAFWLKRISVPGAEELVWTNNTSNVNGNSMDMYLQTDGHLFVYTSGTNVICASSPTPLNRYVSVVFNWTDNIGGSLFVDGVRTSCASANHTQGASVFAIGAGGPLSPGGEPLSDAVLADFIAWSDTALTDSESLALGNGGKPLIVGEAPFAKHIYATSPITGQKLTTKVSLKRRTNAVSTNVSTIAVQKQ